MQTNAQGGQPDLLDRPLDKFRFGTELEGSGFSNIWFAYQNLDLACFPLQKRLLLLYNRAVFTITNLFNIHGTTTYTTIQRGACWLNSH